MQALTHRHVKQAADGLDAHNAAQAEAFDPLSAADFRPEPPPAVLKVHPSLPRLLHAS